MNCNFSTQFVQKDSRTFENRARRGCRGTCSIYTAMFGCSALLTAPPRYATTHIGNIHYCCCIADYNLHSIGIFMCGTCLKDEHAQLDGSSLDLDGINLFQT